MNVLIYVAIGLLIMLLVLSEFGFDSVVARLGRRVIWLVSFGRWRVADTGDPADTIVGAISIIAVFILIVFFSGLM